MWSAGVCQEVVIKQDHGQRVVTSAANLGNTSGNTGLGNVASHANSAEDRGYSFPVPSAVDITGASTRSSNQYFGVAGNGLTSPYATVTSSTFHVDAVQAAKENSPQLKSEDASDSVERSSATDDSDITKPHLDHCDSADRSNAFSSEEKEHCVGRKDVIKAKGKKKLGRPASFNEDEIEWDKLTADERRKIRRRLSNRASAHRVRQRRMEMISTMQQKLQSTQQQLSSMLSRLASSDAQKRALMNELSVTKEKYHQAATEAMRLHNEVLLLRSKFTDVKCADNMASASAALTPDSFARAAGQLLGSSTALNSGLTNGLNMMGYNTMNFQAQPCGMANCAGPPESMMPPPPMSSQFSSTGLMTPDASISQPLLAAAAGLDRATTLSFSLSELEGAPSLGLGMNDLQAATAMF